MIQFRILGSSPKSNEKRDIDHLSSDCIKFEVMVQRRRRESVHTHTHRQTDRHTHIPKIDINQNFKWVTIIVIVIGVTRATPKRFGPPNLSLHPAMQVILY